MSNIKAIDELRKAVKKGKAGAYESGKAYYDAIDECVGAIEREIAERFMPLPCDADGVPIHTGDLMERCCAEDTERFTAWFFAANGDALDDETLFFKPSECRHYKPRTIPAPDTLHIRMTRGEKRIADELRKQFGGFKRVVIDVDGEWHEFSADSLIWLLEEYEDGEVVER